MARIEQRVIDDVGVAHKTPEAAAVADLTRVLLGTRVGSGVVSSVATLVIENRAEIERIYPELDANTSACAGEVIRLVSKRAGK